MTDQQNSGRLRPEVEALISGMDRPGANHGRCNIAAVHFDGPVLNQMVDVFVEPSGLSPKNT